MAVASQVTNSVRPVAVVTSDNHLRDRTWVDRRALVGDAYFAFEQITSYACEHNVPAILAAGDLIDKRRNEADVADFVRGQMDKLQVAGVQFAYIQGQHELQYPCPWFSAIHAWPKWMDCSYRRPWSQFVLPGELAVAGLDWRPAGVVQEALQQVPDGTNILLAHQVTQEFMGGVAAAELSFGMVPKAELLVIGDYHVHQKLVSTGADGQRMVVLSPGSTVLQNIGEESDKKFFVLYDDLSVESVLLRTRPFLRTNTIASAEELDVFCGELGRRLEQVADENADLPEELRLPILDVWYTDAVQDAYKRVTQQVGDKAHLFLRVFRSEQERAAETVEVVKRREAVREGLLGCLPLVVDAEKDPDVYHGCHRLLSAVLAKRDPREELQSLRDEMFT